MDDDVDGAVGRFDLGEEASISASLETSHWRVLAGAGLSAVRR